MIKKEEEIKRAFNSLGYSVYNVWAVDTSRTSFYANVVKKAGVASPKSMDIETSTHMLKCVRGKHFYATKHTAPSDLYCVTFEKIIHKG